ncbi:SWIM zinc finger [Anaerovirgula multivorans]|uniref:SWIM zinc finger n=1 Tax=Anaerovirgula multivorans TaxID=312168 RepID=A0A239G038_9FIRM|nr:SNF2 helicase associated domain-containing protein [Anaerovirgula multivorans]SNS62786.1 SWIM zinc finger [Anaerovirgula multivorans]
MFQIDEALIEDIVSDSKTYYKGKDYYKKNRVVELLFHPKDHHFQGKVKGSYLYQVEASFDSHGKFLEASCTCPAYDSFWGYCKHIVAVLLTIKEKNEKGRFQRRIPQSQAQEILEYFRNLQQEDKTPVQLEVTYEVQRDYDNKGCLASYLSLRIGSDRLYVVKNLKEFMAKFHENEEIYFGKKFTFDPMLHKFHEEDEKIIDLIQEIYQHDTFTHSNYYGSSSSRLFHGKQVALSSKTLKRFFHIAKEGNFFLRGGIKADILGRKHPTLWIYEGNLPISFELDQSGETMVLNVKEKGVLLPLVPEWDYFLTKQGVCRVFEDQKKKLMPFFSLLGKGQNISLRVSKEEEESFLSEVYPIMEEIAPVKIGERLEKSLYKPPFQGEVYFDKKDNEIKARLQWIYGDMIVNPFSANPKEDEKRRILMRNFKKEKQVIDFFEENEFKVRNEEIYLEEEGKIFEMLQKGFQELQQVSDVYYSEDFKAMEIKKTSSIKGGIRLNTEEDLLEFHFGIEGIEDKELRDILKSLKEKKKYYRLKEGSFLPLEEEALSGIEVLMQQLDITEKDIQEKIIKIPKFRGLYVEELLKDNGLDFIKRNRSFKKFVEDVKEFEEVEYEVPQQLQGILRNYQHQGFRWLKILSHYGLGGILADDMGLGKTLQILSYLSSQKEEKGKETALIVAPTSLVYNWLGEIEKFTPELSAIAVAGNKREREEILKNLHDYDIVVTSYPLLRRDIELYEDYSFRYCIIDEAQHIKNPSSQNAKSVKDIKATHRFALTGTPIENALIELWSIFDFVMPGYLSSQHKFKKHFEVPIIKDKDEKALRDLGKLLKPFVLRRLKKDVLQELPEKTESKMVAELTAEQKKV